MKVFILGGGPAGLALAHGLSEKTGETGKYPFELIEAADDLGGLARTLEWGDATHDLGPHKIFTLDQDLRRRVRALLPDNEWIVRDKRSRIFMNGHFLPYPPSPFALGKVFGWFKFFKMTADFGLAKLKSLVSRTEASTFAGDLEGRMGRSLYQTLFEPIALKLWGDPLHLDVKLSKGRVQTPKITEVLARMLKVKKSSEFEALTFEYPRGGLQQLWRSIERQGLGKGVFHRGTVIKALKIDGQKRVTEVVAEKGGQTVSFPVGADDFVVSTLPIGLLPGLFGSGLENWVGESIAKNVVLNDLLLVFLRVDTPDLFQDSWMFIPDPKVAFHRVSEQESFDPGMTGSKTVVCCEIMSHEGRPMGQLSNDELVARSLEGLKVLGYEGLKVLGTRVVRLNRSYPVYRPGFEPELKKVLETLDGFSNFKTIGRQGSFNYVGTLDAMDMGYGMARWLNSTQRAPWRLERERTEHYPVLD